MQAAHCQLFRQLSDGLFQFLFKVRHVVVYNTKGLGALRPAGAKPAKTPTKGDMKIHRDRLVRLNCRQQFTVMQTACVRFKTICRRVAGVPGHFCVKKTVFA